jgi:signal transduction histidine kinase
MTVRRSARQQLFIAIALAGPLSFLVAMAVAWSGAELEREAQPIDSERGFLRDLDRMEVQVDDLLTKGDLAIGSGVVYLRTPALRSLTLLQKEIGALTRKSLRPAQKSSLGSMSDSLRVVRQILLKAEGVGAVDLAEPLRVFDREAGMLVRSAERLRNETEQQLADLRMALGEKRRQHRVLLGVVSVGYIFLLVIVWRWTTRAIVDPLQQLEQRAAASLREGATFSVGEQGGAEVYSLASTISALVGSLEDRVRARTSELQAQAEDLENEIANRVQAESKLAAALEMAEAGSRAKTDFLAQMSHELRTPLGALLGYADMLSSGELGTLEQESSKEAMNRNGEYLLGLISDILSISEAESGMRKTEISEVDLVKVGHEAIETFAPLAARSGIGLNFAIEGGTPETIRTDPRNLRQIIFNLVGNALKFSPEGEVSLTIAPSVDSARPVRISVQDSGPGIRPDDQEKIFDAFFQVDPDSQQGLKGVGLGLAISSRLATAIDGLLELDSEVGKGSVFHLRLPLQPDREASIRLGGTPRESSTRPSSYIRKKNGDESRTKPSSS